VTATLAHSFSETGTHSEARETVLDQGNCSRKDWKEMLKDQGGFGVKSNK